MTDAEQIEAWRSEFIEYYRTKRCTAFHDGRFLDDRTEILYHGWLAAKRSQPVIELPETDCHCYDDDNGVNVWSYMPDTVFNAITVAGYKYKVKS